MVRQTNVGTKEHTTAQEVADLYEVFIENDGVIDPHEDRTLRLAHRDNCAAAALHEAATQVIACVIGSGPHTRRAKRHIRDFEGLRLIHGGLAGEIGPGVA